MDETGWLTVPADTPNVLSPTELWDNQSVFIRNKYERTLLFKRCWKL